MTILKSKTYGVLILVASGFFIYYITASLSKRFNSNLEKHEGLRRDENLVSNCMASTSAKRCSQLQRLRNVRRVCRQYKNELGDWYRSEKPTTYNRLLVDDKHKILYCAVGKAASTTFYNMFYFAVTGHNISRIHCDTCWKDEGLVWLSSFPMEEIERRLQTYYKVITVRHPLDRLVSCWNGKFANARNTSSWIHHGRKMVEMFRTIPTNSSLDTETAKGANFDEFLRYVNDIEAVNQRHNPHWEPIVRMCHPCAIDYDYIVKVETLDVDSKAIIRKLNLNMDTFPKINVRREHGQCPNPFSSLLREYSHPGITPTVFNAIHKLYQIDMKLFGYTWNEYYSEGRCDISGCC